MKKLLRIICDVHFPERSNYKKIAPTDCLHKFQRVKEKGKGERGDSAMNSAQNVTYNSTATFTPQLRSIPGCKKWLRLLDIILPLHADFDLILCNITCSWYLSEFKDE